MSEKACAARKITAWQQIDEYVEGSRQKWEVAVDKNLALRQNYILSVRYAVRPGHPIRKHGLLESSAGSTFCMLGLAVQLLHSALSLDFSLDGLYFSSCTLPELLTPALTSNISAPAL